MQVISAQLALAVLGCLLFVPYGDALRCWVCSSNTDIRCRDPFNATRLAEVDCERHRATGYNDYVYCQKLVTTINGGESKVLRKCVFSRLPLEGACFDQPQDTDYLRVEHCSTCDIDGCNGARTLSAPAPATAAAVATGAALATSWLVARSLH